MIDETFWFLEAFVGLPFMVAGALMLRRGLKTSGAVTLLTGGALSFGGALYERMFTPNNFIPVDQVNSLHISAHSVYVLGVLLCAVGTVVHATKARR